jgi:hypothetical protein
MLSRLRKDLIYTDTDPDVLEHDDDLDAEMYTYDKRQVYRGRYDPRYTSLELDVHWLYDENSKRVGLVEYESGDFNKFSVLWYYNNPYATLLQDPNWKSTGKTLWSMLSEEAYQDCLEDDFKNVVEKSLYSPYRLVFPSTYFKALNIYECENCKKRTLTLENACPTAKKVEPSYSSILFLDDSFILYEHFTEKTQEPHDDDEQLRLAVEEQPSPPWNQESQRSTAVSQHGSLPRPAWEQLPPLTPR